MFVRADLSGFDALSITRSHSELVYSLQGDFACPAYLYMYQVVPYAFLHNHTSCVLFRRLE